VTNSEVGGAIEVVIEIELIADEHATPASRTEHHLAGLDLLPVALPDPLMLTAIAPAAGAGSGLVSVLALMAYPVRGVDQLRR
jgi:hypothetical protein